RGATPAPRQPATLSSSQIKEALPKLRRRLGEARAFDPTAMRSTDEPVASALVTAVNSTLVDVFGPESLEYQEYKVVRLYRGQFNLGGVSADEIVSGYLKGKAHLISDLETIIKLFEEKLSDSGDTPIGRALRAYEGLDLYAEIERAAGEL